MAAAHIGQLRGGPAQTVRVAAADVLREASARFSIDGRVPELWDKVSGLYACGGPGPGALSQNRMPARHPAAQDQRARSDQGAVGMWVMSLSLKSVGRSCQCGG